jgi:hypothetical protein
VRIISIAANRATRADQQILPCSGSLGTNLPSLL